MTQEDDELAWQTTQSRRCWDAACPGTAIPDPMVYRIGTDDEGVAFFGQHWHCTEGHGYTVPENVMFRGPGFRTTYYRPKGEE